MTSDLVLPAHRNSKWSWNAQCLRAAGIVVVLLGLAGCAGSTQRVRRAPPPAPVAGEEPDRFIDLTKQEADGYARWQIAALGGDVGKRVVSYKIYMRPRYGAGASFGAAGMYFDYFFLDEKGQILGSARRQVD